MSDRHPPTAIAAEEILVADWIKIVNGEAHKADWNDANAEALEYAEEGDVLAFRGL